MSLPARFLRRTDCFRHGARPFGRHAVPGGARYLHTLLCGLDGSGHAGLPNLDDLVERPVCRRLCWRGDSPVFFDRAALGRRDGPAPDGSAAPHQQPRHHLDSLLLPHRRRGCFVRRCVSGARERRDAGTGFFIRDPPRRPDPRVDEPHPHPQPRPRRPRRPACRHVPECRALHRLVQLCAGLGSRSAGADARQSRPHPLRRRGKQHIG
ncbi:hypothetical protein DFJ74DRAFT_669268 [Hyaloraphidium curvatum]|nr:hypothetical protein DFJ74DRAFT_669268 [Hyaloraphidium curvatum]